MTAIRRPTIAACLLVVSLGGCALTDPLEKPDRWQPLGANEANLAASVENPDDLVRGRSDPDREVGKAAVAVARYRADQVKPLPDSSLAQITLGSSGGQAQAPGIASGAGNP